MAYDFAFENMDVYRLARGVARWMRQTTWPTGASHLRDQGTRAADSIVLNIAEGLSRGGKPGRNHFRIAQGSAGEVLAVLDLIDLPGGAEQQQLLRRVGAMLQKLKGR